MIEQNFLTAVHCWCLTEKDFALATIIAAEGSSALPVGSMMAISSSGEIAGSVSGGCAEGYVFECALNVIESGNSTLEIFGPTESPFGVNLMCGGWIAVSIDAFSTAEFSDFAFFIEQLLAGVAVSRMWRVGGSPAEHAIFTRDKGNRGALSADIQLAQLASRFSTQGIQLLDGSCPTQLWLSVSGSPLPQLRLVKQFPLLALAHYSAKPPLIIIGAGEYTVALSEVANLAGFEIIICDTRSVFVQPQRFPRAHQIVCSWPDAFLRQCTIDVQYSICVLSHDEKIDLPTLEIALRSKAGYIGALGSRATDYKRREELKERGFSSQELARLHSPIGLDIGGNTPQEVAISIVAEIIYVRSGKASRSRVVSLNQNDDPIH